MVFLVRFLSDALKDAGVKIDYVVEIGRGGLKKLVNAMSGRRVQ